MAIATPGGGAHRDEHQVSARNPVLDGGGKAQSPRLDVAGYQAFETRLVDGDIPVEQRRQFGLVALDTGYIGPEFGKAGPDTRPT